MQVMDCCKSARSCGRNKASSSTGFVAVTLFPSMMSTTNKHALVVFSPSGRRGRFDRGTLLLQAARSLGVDIDSVCGGRGLCGRCQVQVTEGDLPKHGIVSDAGNLSVCGETEEQFREQHGMSAGCRLSCLAKIEGDLSIDVPVSSQIHKQVIRKPFEAHDIDINPIVHAYLVEVSQSDIHDASGDLQRLYAVLRQDWQLDNLSCALPVQQQLQPALRDGDRKVTVAVRDGQQIIAVWPGLKDRLFGVAVDVGSTTVAAQLCDLRNGDVLASAGRMNPQIRFGEDLMSRVSYIMMNRGSERELTDAVRDSINELITDVAAHGDIAVDDIVEMTIVGNPIMQHLLLGISPVELGTAPFTLANQASTTVTARELGLKINAGGHVYLLPCIAGHVGADTAAVLLAEAPHERDEISLIVDVGTNAELLLGNRERLLAASSPTGPAFEGAEISSGQRAAPGAIERVRIDRQSLEPRFKVIGCDLWSDDPRFSGQLQGNGMLPDCARAAVSSAGNAAGTGARIALLDSTARLLIEEQVREIEKIETAVQKDFQQFYVDAMPIPHQSHIYTEEGQL
jgi:uncharacterized 2Fe-2S/4Fe-4S cluster protein (DUF4445 family)